MQHELKTLEQRWGLALHSAAFGVWDLDPLNEQVHYSPQWKAMLGYGDADEPDSTATWRARVHPDDLQPMMHALAAHLAGRTPVYEREFRLRAADGSYRVVLSRGRVVERDAAGRATRMVGTLTDLTDRRQAESLRLERDRAEAASQAKTEFLSRMSHELRTPLNAVLGFAQLLKPLLGGADLDAQQRYVDNIEQAGWQLLSLIDDVLDLAQAQAGTLRLQIEPVPLAPLVDAVCAALAGKARARAIAWRRPRIPPGATVRADAARLEHVLMHLVGNAIKYNRAGGTVSIEAVPLREGWELVVRDSGAGIPAEQLPHLFEPFQRLGRSGASIEGAGLGLSVSHWLVDRMGGKLSVKSGEGVGTMVSLVLSADSTAQA